MKNPMYKITMAILLFFATTAITKAQTTNSKPAIFGNYASEINCDQQALASLFSLSENSPVNLQFSGNFSIAGTLTSSVQKYNNLKSLVIRLSNFPGVVLTISKWSDANNPERYVGRMISSNYSDGYEIAFENEQYKLKKIQTAHIIQPCH